MKISKEIKIDRINNGFLIIYKTLERIHKSEPFYPVVNNEYCKDIEEVQKAIKRLYEGV